MDGSKGVGREEAGGGRVGMRQSCGGEVAPFASANAQMLQLARSHADLPRVGGQEGLSVQTQTRSARRQKQGVRARIQRQNQFAAARLGRDQNVVQTVAQGERDGVGGGVRQGAQVDRAAADVNRVIQMPEGRLAQDAMLARQGEKQDFHVRYGVAGDGKRGEGAGGEGLAGLGDEFDAEGRTETEGGGELGFDQGGLAAGVDGEGERAVDADVDVADLGQM